MIIHAKCESPKYGEFFVGEVADLERAIRLEYVKIDSDPTELGWIEIPVGKFLGCALTIEKKNVEFLKKAKEELLRRANSKKKIGQPHGGIKSLTIQKDTFMRKIAGIRENDKTRIREYVLVCGHRSPVLNDNVTHFPGVEIECTECRRKLGGMKVLGPDGKPVE